jgi:HAD superfamily hydrolase (TIGR01509 family)
MTLEKISLVIFDCDGVLADSEMLSARVLMSQLAALGIELSLEQFLAEFLGRSFSAAQEKLRERTGRELPARFAQDHLDGLMALYATDLRAMAGVEQVLSALKIPKCVASGSAPARLDYTLNVCGLNAHFGSHVYSASMVKNSKPAPDLFLYAAEAHGVSPDRCLVLEDSEMGVRAARAANMKVWHFTGGSHIDAAHALPPGLSADRVVGDMAEVLRLFVDAGLCRKASVAPKAKDLSCGA